MPIIIDWDALWELSSRRFALGAETIHGPDHWRRVERYGVQVAKHNGADVLVVRLFAVLHDVCRQTDGIDEAHGARAAEFAAGLHGEYFELSEERFALLHYACTWHTAGQVSADPTIGACWDADRLDLWRAGITPKETLMSTAHARGQVRAKRVGPRYLPEG